MSVGGSGRALRPSRCESWCGVWIAPLWLAFVSIAGCKGSPDTPQADFSEGLPAQGSLAKLRTRWDELEYARLRELGPSLNRHVESFPNDPSTRAAMGMLALVALESGDSSRAKQLAELLERGPKGSAHDTAVVVLGALERRAGQHAAAFKRLRPLFNRVIDAPTRYLLNRELALAAIAGGRHQLSADYVHALVSQSSPALRGSAERDGLELLPRIDPKALLELLAREVTQKDPDRWLLDALSTTVARAAIERQDPKLARALLDVAASLLADQGDAVARIAARGAGVRLERNTVGLVMPLRSDAHRQRGIEVASGLAFALGIPGSKTKLLVRDDQADLKAIDDTLALLNADGAAVIIAGYDTQESDLALSYAERTNVPLVLLVSPSRPVKKDGPVFVLGEARSASESTLVGALAENGKKRVAVLAGDRGAETSSPLVVAKQPCGASLDFVRTSDADALVVTGGASCAVDAVDAFGGRVAVALGLEASAELSSRGMRLGAGLFPLAITESRKGLAAYTKLGRGQPSWWTALGHDAGALVKDAIVGLPTEDDAEALASAMRKRIVADGIAKAEAELWTTDGAGFGGERWVKRPLRVLGTAGAAPKKK